VRGARTITVAALAAALAGSGPAQAQEAPPGVEAGFAAPGASSRPCADRTYADCRRLRFSYGPIHVTPGNNAQLIGPVTIEKPAYDGYILNMRANLVRADGSVPNVDILHLHHAVWASIPQYGSGLPFFAAGEEKTVLGGAPGYGMAVRRGDTWILNYMLHNLITTPENVWVTYDIEYVPKASAEAAGIKRVVPIWLDVRNDRGFYPVFNVQKGHGRVNPETGTRECHFPRDTCAPFDPWGRKQEGNGVGWEWKVPERFAGTLVGMGGHLHPGGLRDEVDVVRNVGGEDRVRRIFNSEAVYYDPNGPVSWDMSMTVTKPGWRVRIEPGDRIRLNAVYETDKASWYEGMGIVMGFVAPDDASGVDPFETVRTRVRVKRPIRRRKASRRRGSAPRGASPSRARKRPAPRARARRRTRYRWVYRWVDRPVPIDTSGVVTHGHLPENDNHGGEGERPLPSKSGRIATDVTIAGFQYFPGDLSRVSDEGIPLVRRNSTLTFRNADAAGSVWHTITTCRPPCTGRTGISYPLADSDNPLDSLELGYGYPADMQPTAQTSTWRVKPAEAGLASGETYTYFCRVHPFMRGAFKVVE